MNKLYKTAVITGISSGIGLALIKKLLNENYNVIGTTRSGKLDDFSHSNLQVISLEATNQESRENAIKEILAITTDIDLLVNNAGIAPDAFSNQPDFDSFTETIDTNVTSVIFFTESLLKNIKTGGKIAFISSSMGLLKNAAPNGTAYRISKNAINMYAAMLATRVIDKEIIVTPIHPGWVQTKLGGNQAPFTTEDSADGIYNAILLNTASGKFWDITIPGLD
ncbi:SDR family NAD(P)-dependent oxidoreductase [Flavobacterium panici]|uniref:SDR family NAD(P)-dependent oxidoreductase n=1 Tax=Flavobacterium panici TaxID=2654843 RepID=A0A9N8J0N3_9FLAO|nr:SDR family NAD(P)-dependent oxidoreductase [Flavobacterium panici]CAC9974033.1 SDR family NAD(P)-dependent oxidoreductase [Flavobacterium panici]